VDAIVFLKSMADAHQIEICSDVEDVGGPIDLRIDEETSSLSSTTSARVGLIGWRSGLWAPKCRSTHAISNSLREVGGSHRANNPAQVGVGDRDRANDFEILPVHSGVVNRSGFSLIPSATAKNTKRLAKHICPDKPQSHRTQV
jgi:hypothetical protein